MDKLPTPNTHRPQRAPRFRPLQLALVLLVASVTSLSLLTRWREVKLVQLPINAQEALQKCQSLNKTPGPPPDFHSRLASDRFEHDTPPTLIKNATIWTGRIAGLEVVTGDIFLDKGLIISVGNIDARSLDIYKASLVTLDAGGRWVTPGIVDMHSHLGVDSAPALKGADDTNSLKGITQPWLRSLDGLNTHDDAYALSISGGVTTANVLPGSANAIGGQAFTIKLRPTTARSPSSMLLEPPFSLNGTTLDPSLTPRWRQMKHACGENPSRVYDGTRMDTIWAFRQAYNTAQQVKKKQDEYCSKALNSQWEGLGDFPEDLQWEALVDVLRGRVKVHTHCYETTDLDGLVRLSNEFQFPIAAFHHAHETYLVPDLLKKAYGTPPAVALFATNARYKREAYRGSEFAPRILADNGLRVVMKSDHPVLNSRHLLYEAQQAHYYGLSHYLALSSVITTPATVLGLDHRIGFIKPGHDADVVVWDSHPLALGATPTQVFIDGIAQLDEPFFSEKSQAFQKVPQTPDFTEEAEVALKYEGLPPLPTRKVPSNTVIFTNVQDIFVRQDGQIHELFSATSAGEPGVVVVQHGNIVCSGTKTSCAVDQFHSDIPLVDLKGGSISPSLLTFGSPLGLEHIQGEKSTKDGRVFDPLTGTVPDILGEGSVIKAVDGLHFSGRDQLLAYRTGVTTAVTAPQGAGFLSGLSVAFDTGSEHGLVDGAIVQEVVALHVNFASNTPSISTRIAALRRLLTTSTPGELGVAFEKVSQGSLPLVVEVHSADVIASLIRLKSEVEEISGLAIRLTFLGASEAHLLAKEIGEARIGVILNPARPYPGSWQSRRILPGPPLTKLGAVGTLLEHNVIVGLGIEEQWSARNLRFDVGWAALDAGGRLSKAKALALASVNLEQLLGVESQANYVATQGGSILDFQGKVVGIISQRKGAVELVE
ncbi:carbohydrate esterase family 9 protein [Pluteus cervinus]|uniref:Carbohydrate esterase family 9 protein n=1 Tax=Pluteus cervinus TaxID=181527 RepID=A0ACD3BC15_9AGAR|nr:carbohydrate esterase family 9 protein [Pluteus cervinus]